MFRIVGFIIFFSNLTVAALAAEFIPQDIKSMTRARPPHWLDTEVQRRGRTSEFRAVCAEAISDEGRWVNESAFYLPETQTQFDFRIAEGGSVSQKSPFEYQFSFPPAVFAGLGARLFEAYRRAPVTYLALNQEEGLPYPTWDLLFAKTTLREGFSGIQTLKVSSDGLKALSQTKAFINVRTLILEPSDVEQVLAILESDNFPLWHRLHLIATNYSAADFKRLVTHPRFSQIHELSLSMMNFGDEGLSALAESPALSLEGLFLDITSGELCPNRPTIAGFRSLFQARHLSSLKKLSVRSLWELGPDALSVLADWEGIRTVEYLEFSRSQSDQAMAQLLKKSPLRKLKELRLEQTTYDDKVLDALADNSELVSLTRVAIHLGTNISRDAVTAVRHASHLRNTVIAYDITP